MSQHFRRWGAVWLLVLLFIGSWTGQFITQLHRFRTEAQAHGVPFQWGEYMHDFLAHSFENWQSEWLQLVFQAILLLGAKHWIIQAAAEDLERLETKIDSLNERLDSVSPASPSE